MNRDQEYGLPSYSNLYKGDVSKWLDEYHTALPNVIKYVTEYQGIKTHLCISDLRNATPFINASLIISDLTSLAIRGKGQSVIKICPDLVGAKISIPNKIIAEQGIDLNTNWKNVGYMQCSEKRAKMLLRELRPAIKSNRIIIRPDRIAIFKKPDNNFHAVNCDPDCNQLEWIVSDQDKSNKIYPIKIVSEKSVDIDLTIPYVSNIETDKFIAILDQNKDCISSIRAALSSAAKNIKNKSASELNDIRRDVIDPKLAELERSFKRIVKTSGIKIAAPGIATIAISLSAVVVGPDGLALNSLLGMGGFGLLMTQYADYKEKLDYLKDNPYYLFWKMKYNN
jgi:hypothetical protein